MNTPTPVSDLIIKQFRAGEAHSDGLILTLRDMELQLTAALAEIDRLDVAGIHSCHANCQKSTCVMRRELTAVTEQRNSLADLVNQFISILDITEESDSGRLFHPTNITSCRAGDLQKIGELVEELRRASLHQPTEL